MATLPEGKKGSLLTIENKSKYLSVLHRIPSLTKWKACHLLGRRAVYCEALPTHFPPSVWAVVCVIIYFTKGQSVVREEKVAESNEA